MQLKYKINMARSLQPSTITVMQAERVAQVLSERENTKFKFSCFLNLSRLSLVFTNESGEQRVLAGDNVKHILEGRPV